MGSPALASAAGVAMRRPPAGRALTHSQRQLRAVSAAAAAASRSATPTTVASSPHTSQHFYSSQALPKTLAASHRRLKSTSTFTTSTAPNAATLNSLAETSQTSSFISPRYLPLLLLFVIGGVAWDSQWLFPSTPTSTDPAEQTILGSARKFIPFAVVAREQVSPTSFILTLKAPASSLPGVASLWNVFDLWCVEVKQPQIQVAREYTPLPPPPGAANEDTLRLYVRAVRGGEVSTRLSPHAADGGAGDTVELRGPHGEFDLRSRLGGRGDRVVFLAGGTGIASALQAAHAVLPLPGAPSMTIFWAVRSRDEIQQGGGDAPPTGTASWWSWNPLSNHSAGGSASGSSSAIRAEALTLETMGPSPVSRELLALKDKFGDRLDIRVVVDREGTARARQSLCPPLTHAVEGCKFHSQTAHVGMVDGAPNAGKRGQFKHDDCACASGAAAPGKNVFVVSGPEGFVQAYAGAKLWRDGGQLQGPVGGMLGALQKKNPGLLQDWIVLKL
ncbi:LOW QUALITY PROTEIN: oxidoreductase FAD-binding domain-containing protein [Colletotrichum navitas]|uniref:Oxidoreductase FAD-binding domain-containing protein n=1 Tax=Colletotrichum navitas TaxID=681940 RepID=A0AAD8QE53_9PEZI|nr:LOW QUALITY PROTEIN: oxidoreductase FAD-binding domain-containing protein [Colletotrichum navitas]KAK1599668.1 LOW QUALITY PROTEIN: oxidoreductase FAD-binding domain-containing protein [Colletotrichum navitas]